VPNSVKTITLDDDLLPLMTSDRAIMKIDIEGHEIRALSNKGASKFFEMIKVPVIFMEFESYRVQHGDEVKRDAIDRWLKFLYGLNYTIHDRDSRKLLGKNWQIWPWEIVLMKEYDIGLPLNV